MWAVERREHAFEDTSVIELGDADQSLAYYLQSQPVDGHTFRPPPASAVGFMAKWGLGLLLGDVRRVVRKARAGGRRVILGGHSLGASAAEAYASWDFAGRPGHRDLAGLVLIDGGLDGRIEQPTLAQARAELQEFESAPRFDPFNQGAPWVYGAVSAIAGLYAHEQPQNRSPLDAVALVPTAMQPPFPATNEAWLGWARDCCIPHEARPPPTPGTRRRAAARAPGSTATSHRSRAWRAGSRRLRSTRSTGTSHADCCSTPKPLTHSSPRHSHAYCTCDSRTAARSICRCTPSRPPAPPRTCYAQHAA